MVYETKQFNGYQFDIKGKSVASGRGYTTVFPYDEAVTANKRTKESLIADGIEALRSIESVNGVKGLTCLLELQGKEVYKL